MALNRFPNGIFAVVMKPFKPLISLFAFAMAALLFAGRSKAYIVLLQGNEDSLIRRTDNYIQYVNGIAAHGNRFMKTYIKISGHKKYRQITDYRGWPDSTEETINVVLYKNEPVEYAETPLTVANGTNLEYDNYYYQGKLLAYRIFEVLNNNECTGGILTNTMTAYYDSTGRIFKTLHTLFGSNNQPIDTATCAAALNDFSHLYRTYSETPLAKEGIETKTK